MAKRGELFGRLPAQVVEAALGRYRRSTIRYPKVVDGAVVERLLESVIVSVAESLHPADPSVPTELDALRPGSPLAREPEKAAALVGAVLAATGDSGFDVMALSLAVRDALVEVSPSYGDRVALADFGDWLAAVAIESFAAARASAERERARDQLEEGLPVVLVTPEIPAAFLLGTLDGDLVDSVLSRLLLQVVRVGARSAILDLTGLVGAARNEVLDAAIAFAAHRKIHGAVVVSAVGLAALDERCWREALVGQGFSWEFETHFDRAVDRAIVRSGYRLLHQ